MQTDRLFLLNARQRELLALVASGITQSKDLARRTGIAPKTVDNSLYEAGKILGARDRKAAGGAYLAALENSPETSPGRISSLENSGDKGLSDPASAGWRAIAALRQVLRGVPLGGEQHSLSAGQLVFHMLRITGLSLITLTALVLFVLGVLWAFK